VQFGGAKKIETAAGIECEVGQSRVVDDNVVGIPERNRGKIDSEDLLDLDVIVAARVVVGGCAGGFEQGVNARVGIVTAVRPAGRKRLGGVAVVEDIGIFVRADPA